MPHGHPTLARRIEVQIEAQLLGRIAGKGHAAKPAHEPGQADTGRHDEELADAGHDGDFQPALPQVGLELLGQVPPQHVGRQRPARPRRVELQLGNHDTQTGSVEPVARERALHLGIVAPRFEHDLDGLGGGALAAVESALATDLLEAEDADAQAADGLRALDPLRRIGDAPERRFEFAPAHPVRVLDGDRAPVEREHNPASLAGGALEPRLHVLVDGITDVLLERVGRTAVERAQPLQGVGNVQLDRDALGHGVDLKGRCAIIPASGQPVTDA